MREAEPTDGMHRARGLAASLAVWRRMTALAVSVAAATLVATLGATLSVARVSGTPTGPGAQTAGRPPAVRLFEFSLGLEPRRSPEAGAATDSATGPDGECEDYSAEIDEAASRYGVPRRLVEAVIRVESGFKALAISSTGAQGLMQLMPGTAAALGVRDALDPRQNIEGGVRHLRGLIDRYSSDLRFALAAYNAGEQAVDAYGGVPPYRETRLYVQRVLLAYGAGNAGRHLLGVAGQSPALFAAAR